MGLCGRLSVSVNAKNLNEKGEVQVSMSDSKLTK